MSNEIQQVWRTASQYNNGGGFYVWEILEVAEEGSFINSPFIVECRDGSHIFVCCNHSWTETSAIEFLNESPEDDYQRVTII